MRRTLTTIALSALATITLAVVRVNAQSLPTKKQAADLLAKAASQARITEPGSPPFHFVSKVHYSVGASVMDGTYEVLWEAPDRMREEFRLGSLSASSLWVGDTRYVLRNTPYLPYQLWRVRELVFSGLSGGEEEHPKVTKVYAGTSDSSARTCIEIDGPSGRPTACLDAASGEMRSYESSERFGDVQMHVLSDDFAKVGPARYPTHFRSTIAEESLEVHAEKMEIVSRFTDDVFTPPSRATAYGWCAQPDIERKPGTSDYVGNAFYRPPTPNSSLLALYYRVSADGQIVDLRELLPDGTAKSAALNSFGSVRLAPRLCWGKAIEYEGVQWQWMFANR
ncbi:MAG TPA: hypothetical protein VN822_00725 [Candidatus Acidoferrales bacterium]|nr:hypothetical protein [Candidatus Acidoferrales bacterium]